MTARVQDLLWRVAVDDDGADRCGVQIAASVPGMTLDLHHPGSNPLAAALDGPIVNWMCGLKPVICAALLEGMDAGVQGGPIAAHCLSLSDVLAHRYNGVRLIEAFEYLNASDARRAELWREVLTSEVRPATEGTYQEVATLMLAERMAGVSIAEAVDRFALGAPMPSTFVSRARVAPDQIGCLMEVDGRNVLPLLHDRSRDFLDSSHLGYVGGYSSVRDMRRFYELVLSAATDSGGVLGGVGAFLRRDIFGHEGSGRYGGGFMLGLDRWGIDVAPVLSVGHIGFVRTSIGYAEPGTGFVFAGVRRAVALSDFDGAPAYWSRVIKAARAELLG